MAGLLDYGADPLGQGLLQMGAALMTPRALGGGLANGMLAFNNGAMQAQQYRRALEQDARRNRLVDIQLAEALAQSDDRKRKRELEDKLMQAGQAAYTPPTPGSLGGGVTPGSQQGQMLLGQASGDPEFDAAMLQSTNAALNSVGPQQGISAPTAGGFDKQKYLASLYQLGLPGEALKLEKELKGDNPFGKVDPKDYTQESVARFAQSGNFADLVPVRKMDTVNGQVVDLYNAQPGATIPQQAPWEFEQRPDGSYQMRPGVLAAKTSVARAGAPSITTRVENKGADSAMGQYGPILSEARKNTMAAIEQFDSADRIERAITSGKVNIGPGSTVKNRIDQLSIALGTASNDTKERVSRTRQAVRGLAEMGVKARQALAGQGQITDKEAAAVERAYSADPEDVTLDELQIIVDLTKRASRLQAESYQSMLKNAPEGVARFYDVPRIGSILSAPPPQAPPAAAPSPSNPKPTPPRVGQTVDGYQYMGGNPADRNSWRKVQ